MANRLTTLEPKTNRLSGLGNRLGTLAEPVADSAPSVISAVPVDPLEFGEPEPKPEIRGGLRPVDSLFGPATAFVGGQLTGVPEIRKRTVGELQDVEKYYEEHPEKKPRQYTGFFSELARNTVGGAINVASGVLGTTGKTLEQLWGPAGEGVFGAEDIEKWAWQLHQKGKEAAFTPAQEGGWKGFTAAAVGQAAPYMAAATAGAVVTGSPIGAFAVGFAVEGDNAYRDAIEAGASEEQAQMDRFVVGTINGTIEQMQIRGIFKFAKSGKGTAKAVLNAAKDRALKKIAKQAGKLTYEMAQHSVREGLEESLQELTSIAVLSKHDPRVWDNATKQILMSGLGGMVVGGVLGGGGRIGAGAMERIEHRQLENALTKKIAKESGVDEKIARAVAQDAIDKKYYGKTGPAPDISAKDRRRQDVREKQEEAVAEMDRELAEIQRGTQTAAREAIAKPEPRPVSETKPKPPAVAPPAKPVPAEEVATVDKLAEKARKVKATDEKAIKPPAKEKPVSKEELQRRIKEIEAESEEETTGISKKRRNRLIKETEKSIAESDIYQNAVTSLHEQEMEIGTGFYYVPEKLRGEVEDIIGKRKGFPTKLQKMFTFDPHEGATDWARAVQEALGRGREGVDETWGDMEIGDFVHRVKDALEGKEKKGKLSARALEGTKESADPWVEYKIEKLEMLNDGRSPDEVDRMTQEFAEHYEIPLETFDTEWIGQEAKKLKEIKQIKDEAEQDRQLEILATENVLKREREEAKNAVDEVLRANDLDVEVEKVEEIEEEEIPFERRGKPVGATFTQAGREIVLLAYGADSETGYHEGYHVLRRRLTPKDIRVLEKRFKGDQEAEARAFAEFAKTGKALGYLKAIWQKLLNVLKKVKSGLQGRGFRTVTDIFGEIKVGAVAKEAARPGAAKYEKGVFGQPIHRQLALPLDERKAVIKKFEQQEAKLKKPTKAKPYTEWHPKGKVKIKAALVKAVNAEIEKSMKGRSNAIHTTPEKVADKLPLYDLDLFYPGSSRDQVQEAWSQLVRGGPLFDLQYETRTDKLIREAMRIGHIRAEKARLKAMAKPKKLKPGKLIKINIREVTPVLTEEMGRQEGARRISQETPAIKTKEGEYFEGMKPAELPPGREPPTGSAKPPYFSDAWYRENIKKKKKVYLRRAKSAGARAFLGAEKLLSSSSTRLYNIAPELFRQTRRYVYDTLTRTAEMTDAMEPFLKGAKKMKKTDRKQLDLAFKNADARKITEMVVKYDLQKEYDQAREVLNEIYDAAKEVGIQMEYMRDYWHRHIKDPRGFLEYFQGTEEWSIIEEAIKRRADRAGRKVEELTDEEKAHVVNTLLRGFRTQALTLARPGAAKERTVEVVWNEIDQFYDDYATSILKYIKLMNAKIAEREFFGRETKEIQKLRKLQSARLTRLIKLKKRQGLRPGMTEPRYKEHLSKTMENWKADNERLERLTNRSPTDTIGGYVYDLQRQGVIKPIQEKQIQGILQGIFAPRGMGRGMGLAATAIYVDTLNSPLQALTQLDEFAYSFIESPPRAIWVAIKTALRRSKITPADIGIRTIGEEFRSASMKKALTLLLKSTGFELIDRLNKENRINTVLSKFQAQARRKTPPASFVKRLARVFGSDYKNVLAELRKPIKSLDDVGDDVKYLLFNELLDVQPIAITEMPEAYNKAGKARIVYTLKTFYIKRLNYLREQCFQDMKSPKTFHRGFSKLIWIAFAFALFGAGSDFIKDWIKGRAFDLKDSIVDNTLRMFMSSKYQVTQVRKKGAGQAVLEQLVPPTKIIDEISKDVINVAEGKDRGFELWRSVPVVGELYYWWFGRGKEKLEGKKEKPKVRSRRPTRRGLR